MKVIIDDREPSKIINYFERQGVTVVKKRLWYGDIVHDGKKLFFERKTYADLINSVYSGRLNNQLIKLCREKENAFLMISGNQKDLYFKKINWTAKQNTGLMASLTTRYPNLKVVMVPNDKQLVDCIIKIISKWNDDKKLTVKKKQFIGKEQSIHNQMLCCIPTINLKTADMLLQSGVTISLHYDEKELLKVKGVGNKTINQLKKVNH